MTALDLSNFEQCLNALSLAVPVPQFAGADTFRRPRDLCRTYLAELLSNLVGCDREVAFKSIQLPNNIDLGDLAIIIPKLRGGSNSGGDVVELINTFPKEHALFEPPVPEGVHLRIFFNPETYRRIVLPFIFDRRTGYGNYNVEQQYPASEERAGMKLLLEYSSPNIESEFQEKHLRSTVLGAFIGRLYESMGWDVTRINYLGDWGKNIALLKVGWDKFGNEEEYQNDPIGHLLDVYHQINALFQPEVVNSKRARDEATKNGKDEGEAQAEIENQGIYAERNAAFKKLEEGDEEAVNFWKRVRKTNIENYKDLYSQLGVNFDEYTGESEVSLDTMNEIERLLEEKGICKESAGARVIHMQDYGLRAGTAIIRDRTGATTYLLRDLAAVVGRSRKYEFDKMIIVAANNNSSHFTHLHHILKALGMKDLAEKVQHLKFSEVSKMAEKLGKGYKPQSIIGYCEEAAVAALESDEERSTLFEGPIKGAKALSVSALVVHELSTRSASAHSFDADAMIAFKAGTGPYLQYWYARLCSLLNGRTISTALSDEDYESLEEDDLLRLLAQYPEVTHAAYNSLEPASLIAYLTNVADLLMDSFEEEKEAHEDQEEGATEPEKEKTQERKAEQEESSVPPGQLALYEAARIVLENGMRLVGITPCAKVESERADTPIGD